MTPEVKQFFADCLKIRRSYLVAEWRSEGPRELDNESDLFCSLCKTRCDYCGQPTDRFDGDDVICAECDGSLDENEDAANIALDNRMRAEDMNK